MTSKKKKKKKTVPNLLEAPWEELEHLRGPASDLPEIFATLGDPSSVVAPTLHQEPRYGEAWGCAVSALEGASWVTAHPRAVAELLAMVEMPSTPTPEALLRLVREILAQGSGDKVGRGLDFHDEAVFRAYGKPIPSLVRKVVSAHLKSLASWIDSPSSKVRAGAIATSVFVNEAKALARAPLCARAVVGLECEGVRALALHALGVHLGYGNEEEVSGDDEVKSLLRAHTAREHPTAIRAAAFTGLMAYDEKGYDAAAKSAFVDAMAVPPFPEGPVGTFPLKGGYFTDFVLECVFIRTRQKSEVTDLALAALARGGLPEENRERLVLSVLRTNFTRRALTERADLTPEQLTVLDRLTSLSPDVPGHWIGLPTKSSTLRRWLLLDPPGPLNRVVKTTVETREVEWPLWKVFFTKFDDDFDGASEFIRKNFAPAEVLAIARDADFLESGPHDEDERFTIVGVNDDTILWAFDQLGQDAIPWAEEYIAETIRRGGDETPLGNKAFVPILRSLGKNDELPVRYDAAITASLPRSAEPEYVTLFAELMAHIPMTRRERIFLRQLKSRRLAAECIFVKSLPYCPTPGFTRELLAALDRKYPQIGREDRFDEEDAKGTFESLLEVAKEQPEVMQVVSSYHAETEFLSGLLAGGRKAS